MRTVQHTSTNIDRMMWVGAALALAAGVVYALIGQKVLAIGNVQVPEGDGTTFFYLAALAYFIAASLMPVRNRWLWLAGGVMNSLVIVFYVQTNLNRPDLLLSPGGLISKAVEVGLELVLVYLIGFGWFRVSNPGEWR